MTYKRLDDKTEKAIIQDYLDQTQTVGEIADYYDVTRTTIYRLLKRTGIDTARLTGPKDPMVATLEQQAATLQDRLRKQIEAALQLADSVDQLHAAILILSQPPTRQGTCRRSVADLLAGHASEMEKQTTPNRESNPELSSGGNTGQPGSWGLYLPAGVEDTNPHTLVGTAPMGFGSHSTQFV